MDILEGLHPAGADHIAADIGGTLDAQGEEAPARIERQPGFGHVVARLMVGEEDLAAGGDPLDRPADASGGPQRQYMFGVDEILSAEPATDIGCDKPYRSRGLAEGA